MSLGIYLEETLTQLASSFTDSPLKSVAAEERGEICVIHAAVDAPSSVKRYNLDIHALVLVR